MQCLACILGSALSLLAAVVQATEAPSSAIDAVLVIDSSGSMKRTDPQRLRVAAAQIFISLLRPGDRAAVVSFSDRGYPVVHLTAPDQAEGRARLLAGTERISSQGALTDLHDAILQGLMLLRREARADSRRHLILLSDGHMDTGDAERDAALVRRLESTLLPQVRAADIHIHTIAFTPESDVALLRAVATDTGGLFQLVAEERALPDAFARLFENTKAPSMLPLEGGRFQVDDAVRELTLLVSGADDAGALRLRDPAGEEHTDARHPESMGWLRRGSAALITIPEPRTGTWEVLAERPDGRVYVISDLELRTDLAANTASQGTALTIRAWLEGREGRVDLPGLLEGVQFSIALDNAAGERLELPMQRPDGEPVASVTVVPDTPGLFQVTVRAAGEGFERLTARSLQVTAVPGAEAAPVMTPPLPQLTPPPPPSEPAAAPAPPPAPAPSFISIPWVIGILLMANGLAILVLLGVWHLRRRRAGAAVAEET